MILSTPVGGDRPWIWSFISAWAPDLTNTCSHGIGHEVARNCATASGSSSSDTLTMVKFLAENLVNARSSAGSSPMHGPHQVAQKSTR